MSKWKEREEEAKAAGATGDWIEYTGIDPSRLPVTPRAGLRALRRDYFRARRSCPPRGRRGRTPDTRRLDVRRPDLAGAGAGLNADVLRALGYDAKAGALTVERAGQSYEVQVAHAEKGLVAVDCGWAAEPDAALDPDGPGRLLAHVSLDGSNSLATGSKLASFLFACDDAAALCPAARRRRRRPRRPHGLGRGPLPRRLPRHRAPAQRHQGGWRTRHHRRTVRRRLAPHPRRRRREPPRRTRRQVHQARGGRLRRAARRPAAERRTDRQRGLGAPTRTGCQPAGHRRTFRARAAS